MQNENQNQIEKLPQEVVNQIAAGEVIERPASVIKELVDNSIDAGATKIKVKIQNGGLKLIEVSDNGIGIRKEFLGKAFEAHTTSKVKTIEDLNSLITMGFRGEALSTIVSISNVEAISKSLDDDKAYKLTFTGITPNPIEVGVHEQGSTIRVRNIFGNIPARLKFLKSIETEYRKIVDILIPYFILHPEIHFILEKENQTVYNLPVVGGDIDKRRIQIERVKQILKGEFTQNMVELFYDGSGVKIEGFISHPSHHTKRTKHSFIFVNGRSVTDRGIYRAVLGGYDRFIPHGEQIPFIISLYINPDLVDVNVHPRKEEVRFLNPFRVYSAVEKSVADALSKNIKDGYTPYMRGINSSMGGSEIAIDRLREGSNTYTQNSGRGIKELDFRKGSFGNSIENSLNFSKNILEHRQYSESFEDSASETPSFFADSSELNVSEGGDTNQNGNEELRPKGLTFSNAFQLFKKYLFLEINDELWVVDQHAAAERITFERLLNNNEVGSVEVQNLLVPEKIQLESSELLYLSENLDFFKECGFEIEVENDSLVVKSVPVYFVGSSIEKIFKNIFELTDDQRDLHRNFARASEDILATIACHTSIRSNQLLAREECISLATQLLNCKNPYSCPHGRPVVWRMNLTQIDSNFDRTY